MSPAARRTAGGGLAAVLLAGALAIVVPMQWSPICAMYTPNDVEWYLFFCYIGDPPPRDPST